MPQHTPADALCSPHMHAQRTTNFLALLAQSNDCTLPHANYHVVHDNRDTASLHHATRAAKDVALLLMHTEPFNPRMPPHITETSMRACTLRGSMSCGIRRPRQWGLGVEGYGVKTW